MTRALPFWFSNEQYNRQLEAVDMHNLLTYLLIRYRDKHFNHIQSELVIDDAQAVLLACEPVVAEAAAAAATAQPAFVQVPIFAHGKLLDNVKQLRAWVEAYRGYLRGQSAMYYGVFHGQNHWVPYLIYYLDDGPKIYTFEPGFPPESHTSISNLHKLFRNAYAGVAGMEVLDVQSIQMSNQRNCGMMSAAILESILSHHGTTEPIIWENKQSDCFEFEPSRLDYELNSVCLGVQLDGVARICSREELAVLFPDVERWRKAAAALDKMTPEQRAAEETLLAGSFPALERWRKSADPDLQDIRLFWDYDANRSLFLKVFRDPASIAKLDLPIASQLVMVCAEKDLGRLQAILDKQVQTLRQFGRYEFTIIDDADQHVTRLMSVELNADFDTRVKQQLYDDLSDQLSSVLLTQAGQVNSYLLTLITPYKQERWDEPRLQQQIMPWLKKFIDSSCHTHLNGSADEILPNLYQDHIKPCFDALYAEHQDRSTAGAAAMPVVEVKNEPTTAEFIRSAITKLQAYPQLQQYNGQDGRPDKKSFFASLFDKEAKYPGEVNKAIEILQALEHDSSEHQRPLFVQTLYELYQKNEHGERGVTTLVKDLLIDYLGITKKQVQAYLQQKHRSKFLSQIREQDPETPNDQYELMAMRCSSIIAAYKASQRCSAVASFGKGKLT